MNIRKVTEQDAEALLEIYGYYVEETAISFEYETPSVEEFRRRIRDISARYPYLILEDEGSVKGYTYAGAFKGRAAYDHCCEVTIYLDRNAKGHGYGRALYEALEQELKARGIQNLYPCIADPVTEDEYLTKQSEQFHSHMGYTKVGDFHRCGYKFGRYYNMIWMEKILSKEGC